MTLSQSKKTNPIQTQFKPKQSQFSNRKTEGRVRTFGARNDKLSGPRLSDDVRQNWR